MILKHFGYFSHRLKFGFDYQFAPVVKKFPSPCWAFVFPEFMKLFLEYVSFDDVQIHVNEFFEFAFL